MPYRRLAYLLPAELEDPLVADLWLAGTLGVQSVAAADGRLQVEAYFETGVELAEEDVPFASFLTSDGPLDEADWFAAYRERAQPFSVGRSYFIDPREPREPGEPHEPREVGDSHGPENPIAADEVPLEIPEGRALLRLPARAAFGVGSHESTALALELLEEMEVAGRRVLDVGTGTGVLAFAALRFGARSAIGFDVDPASPFHARENSRLNDLHPILFAGRLAALREEPRFDLALVNVVPEQILPEMPAIVRLLRPGGEMVLSGILAERGEAVLSRMRSLGFQERARRTAGDWIAFRVGT